MMKSPFRAAFRAARLAALAALFSLPRAPGAAHTAPCGIDLPCATAHGSYRVSPPPDAASGAALPVAVFLHGWGGSASGEMADSGLRAAFAQARLLLVLPDGEGGAWSVPGTSGTGRDDRAFIAEVVADIRARWHVDPARIFVAGFSLGASMVWDLACHAGGFRAYVAIAGDFWEPPPQGCTHGPVDLLQFHGLTDPTFPLEGRSLGRHRQGDLFAGFAVLRALDGCPRAPDRYATEGVFVRRAWDGCASGRRLEMVLHPGGHVIPAGWLGIAWRWVQALPAD